MASEAFDLADKYRNPVMILADGMLGQMMELMELRKRRPRKRSKPLAANTFPGHLSQRRR